MGNYKCSVCGSLNIELRNTDITFNAIGEIEDVYVADNDNVWCFNCQEKVTMIEEKKS